MMTSIVAADSLLAIDIGTVTTRALLFDVVGGSYRFIAAGIAPSTAGDPFGDAGEGVRRAFNHLEEITGRMLLGSDGNLIIPSRADGSGVDTFAVTLSAGPPMKAVVVGLLEDVSVDSACRLAETTYARVVEILSLNDRRKQDARIDTILRARPDLIIMAGGVEGGASLSVRKLLEAVGLACFLLPKGQRPQVLFAGNTAMQKEVKESLEPLAELYIAPNIRPTLEVEQLAPAQTQVAQIFKKVRSKQILSIPELDAWAKGRLIPTSMAFGRIIRFLSRIYDQSKGVLGVDVGASSTTVVAAFNGKLTAGVYPHLGLGSGLDKLLQHTNLGKITRWLPVYVPDGRVRDYLYNKAAFPASLPATPDEMAIEQAIARQVMRIAIQKVSGNFPQDASGSGAGLLPWLEPVVATGSVLTHAPTPGQSLLMLLDGLQPTGVTTILLDQNDLVSALGAAADVNPLLVVQVLGSNTILNLGAVIAPVGNARPGEPILRIRVTYEDGNESNVEVKNGSIEVLPLPLGQTANLRLQPLHRFDVGMGPGRGGRLQVIGGALGVVIDARGRPLTWHPDPGRQRSLLKKWLWTLGN
ncbi:MAG: glutamate mutase L [Chloroflexi bacterium]|nr:glutamate mutase L [Chloroflexota bacterium]